MRHARGLRETVAVGLCIALMAVAVPAIATTSGISGTCKNDASWYLSGTVRTVNSGGTTIRVQFNDLCCKPLQFRLVNYNTGSVFGNTIIGDGSQQTLATSVLANTKFLNNFRLTESCASYRDRSFAGTEWY